MRVLITGHTGFKGAWLSLLLASRGHEVVGIALDPLPGGIYEGARIAEAVHQDLRLDIRDADRLRSAFVHAMPDIVVHLAAQPLVRESYLDPRTTFETNVIGTMNVLEAVGQTPSIRAVLIVTTDKVYRNTGRTTGYVEDDALGGDDPYSASKAMADILTQSWAKSFPGPSLAIARAGNVIGGGDVSPDRLLVDLIRGFEVGRVVEIRYPDAVRPWQHVLDCLSGYLTIVSALLRGEGRGAWNIGPDASGLHTVAEVASAAAEMWGSGASWLEERGGHPHEAELLVLDSSKARTTLGWRNGLPFPESLAWTIEWQQSVADGTDARRISTDQLHRFVGLTPDAPWLDVL